jgi:DNA-directed RNA polymerase specialized sigma24 family protein
MNMDPDTQIGGGAHGFPATRESAILRTGSADAGERRRAIEAVISAYWKPVYKYVRIRWRESNEDAKDTVQGFFARAIERGWLADFEPQKGSFRTFVRTCVDHYVSNERAAARAQKRTPVSGLLPLDFETAEGELTHEPPAPDIPMEEFFHGEWVRSVLALAVEALRSDAAARGRAEAFGAWERYDLAEDGESPTYGAVAREIGATEVQVTNWIAAMRRDYRRAVLEKLRELTASEQEYEREAQALFGTRLR